MIPEIFFVALMSTIWIFQNVGDVMVLTQGGPLNSSTTLVYYMYQNAYEYSKMGYAQISPEWPVCKEQFIHFSLKTILRKQSGFQRENLIVFVLSVFMVKSYYSKMED